VPPSSTLQQRLRAWVSDNPDQAILRWTFCSVLAVTIAVLAADLAGMPAQTINPVAATGPIEIRQDAPVLRLPGLAPSIPAPLPGDDKRLTPLPQPDGALAMPMTFAFAGGGRLLATGTITPGISEAFAAEVGRRSGYIKTVVLNSPGGSVTDALAMGRLIRERKLATEVEAGKYCASSCPLVFAGGVERRVGDRAAIGVHQVAATGSAGQLRDEMSIAQNISAHCERYLDDMGVSLQVWVHAMETPHDRLFIFRPDELKSLNIVTAAAASAPSAVPATKPRS
jgi:hypothetical protein